MNIMRLFFFFFFQAEDGIRDVAVTGVQTCALPISSEDRLRQAYAEIQERLESHPGVVVASYSSPSVYGDGGWSGRITVPGHSTPRDRKSTRLNSSHGYISYAVFCLKKKNIHSNSVT